MTLRKINVNFIVFILLIALAWPMSCCYGEACGFDSNCPYVVPPCYKVTFRDHKACPQEPNTELLNGTWMLAFRGANGSCTYSGLTDHIRPYGIDLTVIADGNTTLYATNSRSWFYCECYSANGVGDCNNWLTESWCQQGTPGTCAYSGSAHWEPIWDCSECNYPCTLNIDVSDYENPLHYAREDCCPPGEKGDSTAPSFTCVDANYVVPVYKIWEYDPNAPGEWVEVESSTLVKVTPDPNQCAGKQSVRFLVEALKGKPPAKAKVKCTGAFFTATGQTGSKSVTINIEPAKGECCEDSSGCSSGKCEDGPPPPHGIPGPVLGNI